MSVDDPSLIFKRTRSVLTTLIRSAQTCLGRDRAHVDYGNGHIPDRKGPLVGVIGYSTRENS